jgi:hypothetical protein
MYANYTRIVLAHGPSGQNKDVQHTYVFRTYDHPYPSPWAPEYRRKLHLNPGNATPAEIWKVARATSAAPKYFSPISFNDRTFRDGAIGANNPSKVAIDEVLQMHRYSPKLLISIGTGSQNRTTHVRNPQKLRKAKGWRNLAKVITQLITQSERTAELAQDTCENEKVDYFRWNVPAVGDIGLDEWNPPGNGEITKAKILDLTIDYLSKKEVHLRLVQVARELVALRRARAETERWEVFARKFLYFCPEPSCHHLKATQTFLTRDELRDHGIHEHSYIINVDVEEWDSVHHACLFDKCGHGAIYVFEQAEHFETHLNKVHGVEKPVFMSPRRMEAWLDLGRMTQQQAIQRHDSYEQSNLPLDHENGAAEKGKKISHVRSRSWKGLKPPETVIEATERSLLSTPDKSTGSQNDDDHAESSKRSVTPTPSPARSHTTRGASQDHERADSVESLHAVHSATPSPLVRDKSKSWRFPISVDFKSPWPSADQNG